MRKAKKNTGILKLVFKDTLRAIPGVIQCCVYRSPD
jgi:hypothetical protein